MNEKPEALQAAESLEQALQFYSAAIENSDNHMTLLAFSADKFRRLHAENERLREALRSTTVSLCSAVDLLERGGKKAAASNKMFAQMLVDCKNSFERGLAALKGVP